MSTESRISTLLLVALPLAVCGQPVAPAGEGPALPAVDSVVVVRNVHVVTMRGNEILPDHSVVIRDGRVSAVDTTSQVRAPEGATVIDGGGGWLLPGLVDGHVHIDPEDLEMYLRHGVTTVRNMWGWPSLREVIAAIDEGELLGPTIYSVSSGLDAPPEYWPWTQVVTTPEEGRAAVRRQAAEGWLGIKVYRDLSPPSFDAIVDEARSLGLPVVGHTPVAVGIRRTLEQRLLTVEHLLGYGQELGGSYGAWRAPFDEPGMRALARLTRDAGTWNCPTLAILRRNGRPGHANRLSAVRVLFEEGAELLVGTDAGINVTPPGASMVEEMLLWQEAGIPPLEILRDATADAARLLDGVGEFGTIEVGVRADLVLVRGDPTRDVGNLRTIDGVMVRGRWMDLTGRR